ncbi:PepSY domain-containing protein [Thauera sp.]|jgi:uncharacterized protein HemX|uniref:PepSY domain-containing protein n=1 Tax=Thauera sp. TaxID=1905334 RepID=UPI002C9768D9|nr:PepSY domain-containing protein [Thauera sp.]HRO35451.1 PepSY domain-containing protein [Thauera sp.]
MRTNTLIATLALGAGLFGGGALLVHAFAQDKAPAATQTTAPAEAGTLSMQQVQARLEADGYHDFEKIERERDKYEVKAIDPQGRRVAAKVDTRSGEILEVEVKRDKK